MPKDSIRILNTNFYQTFAGGFYSSKFTSTCMQNSFIRKVIHQETQLAFPFLQSNSVLNSRFPIVEGNTITFDSRVTGKTIELSKDLINHSRSFVDSHFIQSKPTSISISETGESKYNPNSSTVLREKSTLLSKYGSDSVYIRGLGGDGVDSIVLTPDNKVFAIDAYEPSSNRNVVSNIEDKYDNSNLTGESWRDKTCLDIKQYSRVFENLDQLTDDQKNSLISALELKNVKSLVLVDKSLVSLSESDILSLMSKFSINFTQSSSSDSKDAFLSPENVNDGFVEVPLEDATKWDLELLESLRN